MAVAAALPRVGPKASARATGRWWSSLGCERPRREHTGAGAGAGSCARTPTEGGPDASVVAVPPGVSCTIAGTGISARAAPRALLAVIAPPAPFLGVVHRGIESELLLGDAVAAAAAVAVSVVAVVARGEIRRCRREMARIGVYVRREGVNAACGLGILTVRPLLSCVLCRGMCGAPWHGMVLCGMVRYGMVRRGVVVVALL